MVFTPDPSIVPVNLDPFDERIRADEVDDQQIPESDDSYYTLYVFDNDTDKLIYEVGIEIISSEDLDAEKEA